MGSSGRGGRKGRWQIVQGLVGHPEAFGFFREWDESRGKVLSPGETWSDLPGLAGSPWWPRGERTARRQGGSQEIREESTAPVPA